MVNKGRIAQTKKYGLAYYKIVTFAKAILWKTKELSLPPQSIAACEGSGVESLIFHDKKKEKAIIFQFPDILKHSKLKVVGQEEQWYFPIAKGKEVKVPNDENK